jgi:hypothetical protein
MNMQVNKTRDNDLIPMIYYFSATRHFQSPSPPHTYDAPALDQNQPVRNLLERGVDGTG